MTVEDALTEGKERRKPAIPIVQNPYKEFRSCRQTDCQKQINLVADGRFPYEKS